jgi:hypothetical protein
MVGKLIGKVAKDVMDKVPDAKQYSNLVYSYLSGEILVEWEPVPHPPLSSGIPMGLLKQWLVLAKVCKVNNKNVTGVETYLNNQWDNIFCLANLRKYYTKTEALMKYALSVAARSEWVSRVLINLTGFTATQTVAHVQRSRWGAVTDAGIADHVPLFRPTTGVGYNGSDIKLAGERNFQNF